MRLGGWMMIVATALVAQAAVSDAHGQSRRKKERDREQPAPAMPADKRDSLVAAPGTPYHGRAYWLALAQCGGIYFRLNTLYSEAAIQTKVVKPDAAASARYTKEADGASKTATAYFVSAERFLTSDRGLSKEEAILTYDPRASEAGDRLKTVEAALQAARACPALYRACHAAFPKTCPEGIGAVASKE